MNAFVKTPIGARPTDLDIAAFQVVVARSLNDLMQVMAIRSIVYMGEQDCPYDEEYDGNDFAGATHLILKRDGEPIGVVRLRWFADFVKMERLAIREAFRGGPGFLLLVREAVRHAEQKGYRRLLGHPQKRYAPLWRRYFNAHTRPGRQPFVFSDYEYIEMEFDLTPPADAITIDSDPLVLIRPEGEWGRPGVLDRSVQRMTPAGVIGA
jgi:predicted GNAT family N-acyltransferase